jgi:hypothetical protein
MKTHGDSGSKEHIAWKGMIRRCYGETNRYQYYGGRGIEVDPMWRSDYSQFLADMGRAPDDGQTWSVERIDNDSDYCKSNCRWGLAEDQDRNKGIQRNNTSGVTGVFFRQREISEKTYSNWIAQWRSLDGKLKSKNFSADKHGYDEAFNLACEFRFNMIEQLNQQGAGYSEKHGEVRLTK